MRKSEDQFVSNHEKNAANICQDTTPAAPFGHYYSTERGEAEPVLSDDREADEPDAYEGDAGVQAAGLGAKEYGVRTSLAPIL